MPISQSAKKSLRVAKRNNKLNVSFKHRLRETIKLFLQKPSNEGLRDVYSIVDKAVKRNLFKDGKANHLKAKYSKAVVTKSDKIVTKKAVTKKTAKKKIVAKKKISKKMS